jgi:hypothetical protein
MKSHPQKNTLLQAATSNAETKACKRVFFSPPQEKLKNKKFPSLQKNKTSFHRTVQTLTDTALNVNRLEQSVCEIRSESLRIDSRAAANIKIKRNLKKKGFIGSRTVVLLMKYVQVQKMRTTLWHKFFIYLFAFFAGTVSLRIPSFLNFVNPFFVMRNSWATQQLPTDEL